MPRSRQGSRRQREDEVYASMHSDRAREFLRAIASGDLDDDISVLAVNAKKRLRYTVRSRFPVGTRVRLTGTRNASMEGKEGVVVKFNPTRVVIWLDTDSERWPEVTGLRERQELASIAAPPSMLVRI